ncbi:MAG: nucleotidyltransferase domain-containing protein [Proteiniphilum sp.]|jgi:predicted nucleotidyltransferase|uniref:nucleotidyltransferase family protein n=1 Tax=Proteiniphilum sp. TaxID=1926877 RepID=UPI0009269B16|nr:nucleotidyltransferase domain-containing protein [Proteiniphilum sp.]MEA5129304.1 nucleotidyltransferase domain-containing protein [Proteiniphilum sp.]OJV87384.1 MAG: DNA polymerase subunit beta [Bacteroidia bacterium 44-10]
MQIKEEIANRSADFRAVCRDHSVKQLYAFGSAVTDHFNPERSDIDLLVEIDEPNPLDRGEKLISLWDTFEDFFRRKVDLLTNSSLKNPYLIKSIEDTKVLIYDRKGEKIFV